jgi:hypothetical protein
MPFVMSRGVLWRSGIVPGGDFGRKSAAFSRWLSAGRLTDQLSLL